MLGDIVLFTYDELISVITLLREEYKNNITCNGISCAGPVRPMSSYTRCTCTRMSNHVTLAVATTTQKATFHRTRNKCKREYVLPEPE